MQLTETVSNGGDDVDPGSGQSLVDGNNDGRSRTRMCIEEAAVHLDGAGEAREEGLIGSLQEECAVGEEGNDLRGISALRDGEGQLWMATRKEIWFVPGGRQ